MYNSAVKRILLLLLAVGCREPGTADDASMEAPGERADSRLKWVSWEEARKSGKKIFVFFSEKADHASAAFEDVLESDEVVQALAPFACVRADRRDPLFAKLRFAGTPACAFLASDGRVMGSKEYGPSRADFVAWVNSLH